MDSGNLTARFTGNFHPEWGYPAPAPSFMQQARIIAVSMAVGATAAASVILSLVEGSPGDVGRIPPVGRAVVANVQDATREPSAPPRPTNTSQAAQAEVAVSASVQGPRAAAIRKDASVNASQPTPPDAADQAGPMASVGTDDASTTSTPHAPATFAKLAEPPPGTDGSFAQAPNDVAPAPKAAASVRYPIKTQRAAWRISFHQPTSVKLRKKMMRNDAFSSLPLPLFVRP